MKTSVQRLGQVCDQKTARISARRCVFRFARGLQENRKWFHRDCVGLRMRFYVTSGDRRLAAGLLRQRKRQQRRSGKSSAGNIASRNQDGQLLGNGNRRRGIFLRRVRVRFDGCRTPGVVMSAARISRVPSLKDRFMRVSAGRV